MSKTAFIFAAAAALAACSAGIAPGAAEPATTLSAHTVGLVAQRAGAPPPSDLSAPVYAHETADRRRIDMLCDIKVVKTTRGVRIIPVVRSDRSVSGEYALVITKTGVGGSSDISQAGPFDAAHGVRQSLGASEISLERGASFRAVLKVRAGGREICRDVRS
jgi:hypothetical protein